METAKLTGKEAVVEAFRKARATGGGLYEHTVGYGEKYPQHTGENLVVKMSNSATGVHFADRTYERGYDQTHFGGGSHGAKQFIKLLNDVGLNPEDDFIRVYRDLGRGCSTEYPAYWLYIWRNDELMIATTCNPINGDPASETVNSEQGYAGYIGIGGQKELVESATRAIEDLARRVKDKRPDGLFF